MIEGNAFRGLFYGIVAGVVLWALIIVVACSVTGIVGGP